MQNCSRHQCLVYDGPASAHLADIGRTLVEKLRTNHRCLYLNSPAMVSGMRSHLAALGLDPNDHAQRGALILSSDQAHLVDGKFDVSRMLLLLEDAVTQALRDGYDGLWAAGDMTWEFGSAADFTKLLDYERELESFIQRTPQMSGVCLYHRHTLPLHAVAAAFLSHTCLYVTSTLSRINTSYDTGEAELA